MLRYHIEVYLPELNNQLIIAFNNNLIDNDYKPTKHCLDRLKYRCNDIQEVLNHVKNYIPNVQDIFEYCIKDFKVVKSCYRIKFNNDYDIILVLSDNKDIITIYLNNVDDNHQTLNKSLYAIA